MTSLHPKLPDPALEAAPEDPHLGVHVLTEFIYCPRAGIVAFESQPDDCGEDDRPGRLDYLPRYDLANIETALMQALHRLVLLGILLLLTVVGSVVLSVTWHPLVKWAGVLLFLVFLIPTGYVFVDAVRLVARRAAALAAAAREPLFGTRDEPQPIDWWQLRNAGFTAKRYEEPLCDETWKLAGRPYLVLCRGDIRIPVFRQHQSLDTLYRQHFARIAAYCHLIERCTDCRCPYGVILFGTTYKGVALRNSPAAQKAFHDGLLAAREVARNSRRGMVPKRAPDSLCLRCPIGRPVLHRPGVTENSGAGFYLPVRGAKDPEGKLYHSRCGDRFSWLPPHEIALRLPLHPANQ